MWTNVIAQLWWKFTGEEKCRFSTWRQDTTSKEFLSPSSDCRAFIVWTSKRDMNIYNKIKDFISENRTKNGKMSYFSLAKSKSKQKIHSKPTQVESESPPKELRSMRDGRKCEKILFFSSWWKSLTVLRSFGVQLQKNMIKNIKIDALCTFP